MSEYLCKYHSHYLKELNILSRRSYCLWRLVWRTLQKLVRTSDNCAFFSRSEICSCLNLAQHRSTYSMILLPTVMSRATMMSIWWQWSRRWKRGNMKEGMKDRSYGGRTNLVMESRVLKAGTQIYKPLRISNPNLQNCFRSLKLLHVVPRRSLLMPPTTSVDEYNDEVEEWMKLEKKSKMIIIKKLKCIKKTY